MILAHVRSFVGPLLLVLVACAEDVSPRLAVTGAEGVTLSAPSVTLSEGDAPEPWALHVASGTVLPSGRLAVINGNEGRIMIFDSIGQLIRVAGGKGEGPAEFAGSIYGLHHTSAGFAAWDLKLRRLSLFDEDATFITSGSVLEPSAITPIGWLEGMGMLISSLPREKPAPLSLWLIRPDAEPETMSGPDAYPRVIIRHADNSGRRFNRIVSGECVPSLLLGTVGEMLYVADAGSAEIRVLILRQHNSSNSRIVYAEEPRRRVSAEIKDAVRKQFAGVPDDSMGALWAALGGDGTPLAAWSQMIVDPTAGLLFLRHAECAGDPVQRTWTVADTSGVLRGTLTIPAGRHILAAGAGRILTTASDSLGVEYLELYHNPISRNDHPLRR